MKNGFTIIELMLTILVMSVVITLGVPSFSTSIQNNRITSQANSKIGAISFARTEAVKLNDQAVTLCGSTNQTSCNTSQWEQGWILFKDGDRDGQPGNSANILRVEGTLSGSNTLRTTGFSSNSLVRFDSQGTITNSGAFVFCDDRGATSAKAIILNISGQTRSAMDENDPADSIVNDHDGVNIACP